MIQKVILRRFKRFEQIEVPLGEHVVFAGPNNLGKTTVLQAVAAWSLAFSKWRTVNRFSLRSGVYSKAHLMRSEFASVPLRSFDQLWLQTSRGEPIEVELQHVDWSLTMQFEWEHDDAVTVRPKPTGGLTTQLLKSGIDVQPVYIAPMSGIGRDEPYHDREMQQELLGQGKTGDILRNLLVEAHRQRWDDLTKSVKRLFGYTLAVPRRAGPYINAGYHETESGPRLDIASSGSGFRQVVLLLAFLYTRRGSVLLIDEPDAHLHMILQGVIYAELTRIAADQRSQLIIATHSEVVINRALPEQMRVLTPTGVRTLGGGDRRHLIQALRIIQQAELAAAVTSPGILYVEGYTDINLLLAWGDVLGHPAAQTLRRSLVMTVSGETDDVPVGAQAGAHYQALILLLGEQRPAVEILDGDSRNAGSDQITGQGLQRLRWRRYEAESYLVHPAALDRFIELRLGAGDLSLEARNGLRDWFDRVFETHEETAFQNTRPLVESYLKTTKARVDILPPALAAAGILNLPYTRYNEIAEVMLPSEIHPEVVEKLDGIQRAFGLLP
ncbi:MAG: ATP-binding protein [Deltaproteobacteria bacterium]|nr:ATP-binding protein [Deltaproteobacteria bacterium]